MSDSESDDDDPFTFTAVSYNRKRPAPSSNSLSDDDDSDSDIEVDETRTSLSAKLNAASAQKKAAEAKTGSVRWSEESGGFIPVRSLSEKLKAAAAKRKAAVEEKTVKKKTNEYGFSDSDDDSDLELVTNPAAAAAAAKSTTGVNGSTLPKAATASTSSATGSASASASATSKIKKAVFDIPDSDSEDDIDTSIPIDNSVFLASRKATENLLNAQKKDVSLDDIEIGGDENDSDLEMITPTAAASATSRTVTKGPGAISFSTSNTRTTSSAPMATGPMIRLTLRTSVNGPLPATKNHPGRALHMKSEEIRIRLGSKLSSLLDKYKSNHENMLSATICDVKIQFDGETLDSNKTISNYDMEDEDLVDVHVKLSNRKPKKQNAKKGSNSVDDATPDDFVRIKTRIKGGDPSKTHNYCIQPHDSLSKILQVYRKQHGYSSFKPVFLEINGTRVANAEEDTPQALGLVNDCLLEICDEQEKQKQLSRMPIPPGSNGGQGSHVGGITVKIRINGDAKSMTDFGIQPKNKFQILIDEFCTKYKVKASDCKFEFDGDILNVNGTAMNEDLEGGEIIDVSVDKTVLAGGNTSNGTEHTPASVSVTSNTPAPSATRKIVNIYTARNNVSSAYSFF